MLYNYIFIMMDFQINNIQGNFVFVPTWYNVLKR